MFLQFGETIHHPLPWGIPLWDPSHIIFFGVFYLVLTTIGIGLGLVFYRTYKDLQKDCAHTEHAHQTSDIANQVTTQAEKI